MMMNYAETCWFWYKVVSEIRDQEINLNYWYLLLIIVIQTCILDRDSGGFYSHYTGMDFMFCLFYG